VRREADAAAPQAAPEAELLRSPRGFRKTEAAAHPPESRAQSEDSENENDSHLQKTPTLLISLVSRGLNNRTRWRVASVRLYLQRLHRWPGSLGLYRTTVPRLGGLQGARMRPEMRPLRPHGQGIVSPRNTRRHARASRGLAELPLHSHHRTSSARRIIGAPEIATSVYSLRLQPSLIVHKLNSTKSQLTFCFGFPNAAKTRSNYER